MRDDTGTHKFKEYENQLDRIGAAATPAARSKTQQRFPRAYRYQVAPSIFNLASLLCV